MKNYASNIDLPLESSTAEIMNGAKTSKRKLAKSLKLLSMIKLKTLGQT